MKANDQAIKKAVYDYGLRTAKSVDFSGIDCDDDEALQSAIASLWDETSYTYPESFEFVLNKIEKGLGKNYRELRKKLKLDDEFNRGIADGIRSK